MSHKFWTIKEEIQLYKLVNENGFKWSEHAETLTGSTSEAIRKKYRRTDWEALFESYGLTEEEILKTKNIDKLVSKAKPPKTEEETLKDMLSAQKAKISLHAETRKLNEKLREMAGQEMILEKLMGAVQELPKVQVSDIPKLGKTKRKTRPEDACLILSDLHLGLAVKADEVGGITKYNKDIFLERLWKLVDKVIRITDTHRKSTEIENLNIFALGDNVHGSNDAGQWGFLHTEQDIVEQIFTLWLEMEKAILALCRHFKNINFWGIFGNHGRIAKRGMEKAFVNWDYILYKMLERGLSQQDNINFNIPRSPFEVANVKGNKFLLVHGDQVRGWNGVPFYGMVRSEAKFRSLLTRLKTVDNLWDAVTQAGLENADPKDLLQFAFEYCKTFNYMCFPEGTSITMSGGHLKNIEDIKIGDKVIDCFGKETLVDEKYENKYSGDIYEIESSYNYKQIQSTKEHPFFIIKQKDMQCRLDSYQKKKYLCLPEKSKSYPCRECDDFVEEYKPKFIAAKDIEVGDFVKLGSLNENKDISNIKINEIIKDLFINFNFYNEKIKIEGSGSGKSSYINNSIELTDNLLKMLGFWLAEGSYTTNCRKKEIKNYYEKISGISFTFSSKESEFVDFCEQTLKESFGISTGFSKNFVEDSSITLILSNKIVGLFFYGLFGKGASGKSIPNFLMYLNPEKQKNIIYGFIHGDGHTRNELRKCGNIKKEITCCTISEVLGNQMFLLLNRIGTPSSIRRYINSCNNIYYTNSVYGVFFEKLNQLIGEFENKTKYKISRTKDIIIVDNEVFAKIKNIKKIKVENKTVYNFRTKGSHTYVANNFGVHNCMGHFHQMAEIESSAGGRIIMNSCFSGGDDYSINNLQSASTAAQKFFGIHPEGKTWTYDIELDRD